MSVFMLLRSNCLLLDSIRRCCEVGRSRRSTSWGWRRRRSGRRWRGARLRRRRRRSFRRSDRWSICRCWRSGERWWEERPTRGWRGGRRPYRVRSSGRLWSASNVSRRPESMKGRRFRHLQKEVKIKTTDFKLKKIMHWFWFLGLRYYNNARTDEENGQLQMYLQKMKTV